MRPLPFAPMYLVDDAGRIWTTSYGRLRTMRPWPNGPLGHLIVGFFVGGASVRVLVNRIVCTVFHGQAPTDKHEARHLDGNPINNVPSNLAWGTHADNMADMVRHGRQGPKNHPHRMCRGDAHPMRARPELVRRGERSPAAKLNESQVRSIRTRTDARDSQLAREYGVTQQLIFRIKKRLCWKHVE